MGKYAQHICNSGQSRSGQTAGVLPGCDALKQAENVEIELAYFPSYSPNVNLIERLWELIKKNGVSRTVLR